ncbi:Hypothetical protein Tpal_2592 [Trichococcus palustris]|jgi:leader peptidase (prepilin peptidase) / N-methyltransferase|uniref:Prepilin peptidase n=1 Tax=Trichococcus palustris TaxID=140314 RepID=A0A143Z030_9LACT|nr:A24 family peptidase [Trichococcus palustris]CZR00947.1 Hypothetical protein Tpal_2592 [Trichococcus palustris]SFK90633.1 leader peptidase (prepilin peptidase) / N-methyltransferase [Trichococcus palustris]
MLFIGNYFFIFYFGAIFGSFFTALGTRIPIKEGFTFSRSHCVHCNHALGPHDLFPIFSYLFRFGKCAYCNRKIDGMYVVVESLSGLTACLLYYFYSNKPLYLLVYAGIFSILAIISITDYLYLLVPDRFQILLVSAALFLHGNLPFSDWKASAISFAAIFSLLLFTLFVVPDGLGGGDIKLLSILAFAFGLRQSLSILLVSSLSACLFLAAGYFFNKKNIGQRLPFVPFIAIAVLLVHFLQLFYFG